MGLVEAKEAFRLAALAIDGIDSAYAELPEAVGDLPAITMLLARVRQDEIETGPHTSNLWTFRVDLYVALRDFREAQARIEALLPPLLAITRRDPDLGLTCDRATIADDGGEPVFDVPGGVAWKSLSLTILTEET